MVTADDLPCRNSENQTGYNFIQQRPYTFGLCRHQTSWFRNYSGEARDWHVLPLVSGERPLPSHNHARAGLERGRDVQEGHACTN